MIYFPLESKLLMLLFFSKNYFKESFPKYSFTLNSIEFFIKLYLF